ncbi:amidohydrolase family protein [bacterium]|nr:amidohydrolase family protein [bacterium]
MIKILLTSCLILILLPFLFALEPPKSVSIYDVTVIDGTGSPPKPHRTVTLSGNRITNIKESDPSHDADWNGTGRFLIPGLWDMHVHLTYVADVACPALVANGVTSVRDLGGNLNVIDWMRRRIDEKDLIGPRIFRAGPVVDGSKPGVRDRIVIDTGGDSTRAVSYLKERSVDFIKVHNGPNPDAYFALLKEAKRQSIQVVGHIPISISDPGTAIDAGHGSVEHIVSLFEGPYLQKVGAGKSKQQAMEEFTDAEAKRLAQKMVKNGTWFDPTLITYWARSYQWDIRAKKDVRDKYISGSAKEFWRIFPDLPDEPEVRKLLKEAFDRFLEITRIQHQEGVRFLVGTDLGARYMYPGFSVHDELQWLVNAGLSPMEALQAGTRNCAESLGRLKDLGTIEENKLADFILLDKNPLTDIANTKSIVMVFVDGQAYTREDLDGILEKIAQKAPGR